MLSRVKIGNLCFAKVYVVFLCFSLFWAKLGLWDIWTDGQNGVFFDGLGWGQQTL